MRSVPVVCVLYFGGSLDFSVCSGNWLVFLSPEQGRSFLRDAAPALGLDNLWVCCYFPPSLPKALIRELGWLEYLPLGEAVVEEDKQAAKLGITVK